MSGLELILPVVFGGVAAGAQVTTALQGMRKPPVQQVQQNQWASKNYNFAQYNDRACVQIGADGSISGASMAGGQCIAFSVTTPPQAKKKKWYQ